MSNVIEEIENVKVKVDKYFDDNIYGILPHIDRQWLMSEKKYIVDIGTSIYCTKHDIGFPGGGFVQSVVNNNLESSYGRADNVNSIVLKFYVVMLYNL